MHQKSWNSFTSQAKEEWQCPACVSLSPTRKHDLSTGSIESEDLTTSKRQCLESDILTQITKQLAQLQTVPHDVRAIDENVKEIKKDNAEFKLKLEKTIEKVSALEADNEDLRRRIYELEECQESNTQYQMRNNIIISNVPENTEENTEETVRKLFDFLKVPVKDYDILLELTDFRKTEIGVMELLKPPQPI